jgi:hypothetical protein
MAKRKWKENVYCEGGRVNKTMLSYERLMICFARETSFVDDGRKEARSRF